MELNKKQKDLLIEMARLTEEEVKQVFDLCKEKELFEKK